MKIYLVLLCLVTSFAQANDISFAVPVQAAWKSYATFPLKNFDVYNYTRSIQIVFDLPTELVGQEGYQVRFSGPQTATSVLSLQGTHGNAECKAASLGYRCVIAFSQLSIDRVQLLEFLRLLSKSDCEYEARVGVADTFSHSLEGVVVYLY